MRTILFADNRSATARGTQSNCLVREHSFAEPFCGFKTDEAILFVVAHSIHSASPRHSPSHRSIVFRLASAEVNDEFR